MTDIYDQEFPVDGPALGGFAVVPGAGPLPKMTRALWVAIGGDVQVTYKDGTTDTIYSVPNGTRLDVRVSHVLPGTTADKISAWY